MSFRCVADMKLPMADPVDYSNYSRDRRPLRNEVKDAEGVEEVPACLEWARDLQSLLNDDEGCELFEKYLEAEECDVADLFFVYACNGLKIQEKQADLEKQARAIYKRYVKSGRIRAISEDVKDDIASRLKKKEQAISGEIFDRAKKEVEEYILKTTFARFIQSDTYVKFVQNCLSGGEDEREPEVPEDSATDQSTSSAPHPSDSEEDTDEYPLVNLNNNVLASHMPTLEEEEEVENATFVPPHTTMIRKPPALPPPLPPMSKAIQRQKRQSQKSMRYAEMIKHGHKPPPNPYHVKSSVFLPPTAYNSDIQSMSSGNYTDLEGPDIECSRSAEIHTSMLRRCYPQENPDRRGRSLRSCAREVKINIPRTVFPVSKIHLAEKKPLEFYHAVCKRLQVVIREREIALQKVHGSPAPLQDDELHCQSILDNHVDRVFKTPPVRTPRSPSPGRRPPLKSPYQTNPAFIRPNIRKDDNDSAIYEYSSGMSTSTRAPLVQPRRKPLLPLDSGCEDSVLSGPGCYNPHDNVREWVNRQSHDAGARHKTKSSVCSGSNRSSCKSTDESKKKKQSGIKEPELLIGYVYEGETVPFVTRVKSGPIRLKEFKSLLTKKGNFRYFFKRTSDEFGSQVVSEEIKDDNQVLPLFEEKIFAYIHPVSHPDSHPE